MNVIEVVTYAGTVEFEIAGGSEYKESINITDLKRKIDAKKYNSIHVLFSARYGTIYDYNIAIYGVNNSWYGDYTISSCRNPGLLKNVLVSETDGHLTITAEWVEGSDEYHMTITADAQKTETFDLDNL